MTKTSKLTAVKIFALILVLMMCLTNVALANSSVLEEGGIIVAQNEDTQTSAQATIEKILRTPTSTDIPDLTFRFQVKPISAAGATSGDLFNKMPVLGTENTFTLSFDSDDQVVSDTLPNTVRIAKETGNIFAGATFDHAGLFIYEISEIGQTNQTIDGNRPDEVLTYSEVVYRLHVYVANNAALTGRYIRAINIYEVLENEDGEEVLSPKRDQIVFINDYVKTNTVIDPLVNSTLSVSKMVTGDLANATRYFDFDFTLTAPDLVVNPPSYYRAYIVEQNADGEDVIINPANNVTDSGLIGTDNIGSYIRISTSELTSFRLRHGQRLVFVDTPVGTSYTVLEKAAPDYTPSVIITTDTENVVTINGEEGEELSTGLRLVGERINSAAFTNRNDSNVPTGLNINDLPFIGLIALPIIALVIFIVVKSRRRKQTTYEQ